MKQYLVSEEDIRKLIIHQSSYQHKHLDDFFKSKKEAVVIAEGEVSAMGRFIGENEVGECLYDFLGKSGTLIFILKEEWWK